jgi:hypothetical protein
MKVGPESVSPGANNVCLVNGEEPHAAACCGIRQWPGETGHGRLGVREDDRLRAGPDPPDEVRLLVRSETAVIGRRWRAWMLACVTSLLVQCECNSRNDDERDRSIWGPEHSRREHGEGLSAPRWQVHHECAPRPRKERASNRRPLARGPVCLELLTDELQEWVATNSFVLTDDAKTRDVMVNGRHQSDVQPGRLPRSGSKANAGGGSITSFQTKQVPRNVVA